MWALVKSLLAKWALFKILLKGLGPLAWLVPVAFLLKLIGLPVLLVLAILAAPVFILLAILGLPLMFVAVTGLLILVGLFALLAFGIAVLKIAIPIFIVYWLLRWAFRNGKKSHDPATE